MIQVCDVCGTKIGTKVEGFGVKAGFEDKGFDLCDDCMAEAASFFVDTLGSRAVTKTTVEWESAFAQFNAPKEEEEEVTDGEA